MTDNAEHDLADLTSSMLNWPSMLIGNDRNKMKCALCSKEKNRSWLCYGIMTGFLLGFSYFVVGVYTHSLHENHHGYANYPGTTIWEKKT